MDSLDGRVMIRALVTGWCDGETELGLFDGGDKGGILDSVEHKRILSIDLQYSRMAKQKSQWPLAKDLSSLIEYLIVNDHIANQ